MEKLKLATAHDLPDGTYKAVWSGDSIFIERPEVDLTLDISMKAPRGRREGKVIVAGPDRTTARPRSRGPSMRPPRFTRDESGRVLYQGTPLPDGPWHTEPDREEFRSPSGRPCIINRNGLGGWCGYVGVAPDHPWHGKDYDAIDPHPDVHGGLTYAERCQEPICHVPQPGESDDVWWLGFDCVHLGDVSLFDVVTGRGRLALVDIGVYRTAEYARAETLRLAEQADAARGAP